jgi:hypothetical protein
VPRKPFGVWFSVALLILVVSLWAGWKLGGRVAVHRDRVRPTPAGSLSPAEALQLEAEIAELGDIQTLSVFAMTVAGDAKMRNEALPAFIRGLEAFQQKAKSPGLTSVVDLNLAAVYVAAAAGKEQDGDTEAATGYIRSAQPLFQSLGWRDFSDDTLRALGRRELDHWGAKPQSKMRTQ